MSVDSYRRLTVGQQIHILQAKYNTTVYVAACVHIAKSLIVLLGLIHTDVTQSRGRGCMDNTMKNQNKTSETQDRNVDRVLGRCYHSQD